MHPRERIFDFSPLDTRQSIVQHLGDVPDFTAADCVFLIADRQLTDGRNDRRRTAAPRLFQGALFHRGRQFLYRQKPFLHGIPFRFQYLDTAFTGDAG